MHEVYNNKFVSFQQPAWHRLGNVFADPLDADEAWTKIGPYEVLKVPLFANDLTNPGQVIPVKNKFAMTGYFPDEGKQYHYGTVDARYELIAPKDLVNLWQITTGAKIETMGVLQQGKRFFMTTKLPGFDVRGDQHLMYMSVISPHGTGEALLILISPVRVVCMNTAQMAIHAAKVECKVPHVKGATNRTGAWLKEQYEGYLAKTEAVQEALTILADAKADQVRVDSMMEGLFPMPSEAFKEKEGGVAFDEAVAVATEKQQSVLTLFDGAAKGADTPAFAGTMFGVYNSVVEYADYHKKGSSAAWGLSDGAKLKEKAFRLATDLVTV